MEARNPALDLTPEGAPHVPVAAVSASTDSALRLFCGGRAVLERELLWAAVLGRPTFAALLRQLTPSANDAFFGLPSSGEPPPPVVQTLDPRMSDRSRVLEPLRTKEKPSGVTGGLDLYCSYVDSETRSFGGRRKSMFQEQKPRT
jgi:hypothetical protein